jgi:hypothetical protein
LLDGLYYREFSAMFSKPLAFVLLTLGCLTAAAGGAYVATRHNMSEATTRTAAPSAALAAPVPSQTAGRPSQAVAETEAAVSQPKAEAAPAPASASAASTPTAAPVQAEAPVAIRPAPRAVEPPRAPAKMTAAPPAESTAAHSAARTVPMTNPGAPVSTGESTVPSQAGSVPAPAPPRPAEAVKPVFEEPQPEAPREPQYDELILPAASVIGLQVETSLSSERARVEDRVDARVSRDVMAAGRVAIPAGSRLIGSVTTVERGSKVKEPARLGIRFHTLVLADGAQVQLHTEAVYRIGEDPTAGSTKKIGGAAIGGAIIGAILGGGKGAAIGGATGAAGGTAAVMAGDRQPATLRPGEYLNVKLSSPATITVARREE